MIPRRRLANRPGHLRALLPPTPRAGQEPLRELEAGLKAKNASVWCIGGSDVAAELDAKRAIDQGRLPTLDCFVVSVAAANVRNRPGSRLAARL